jgi:hypothetical protein
MKTFLQLAAAFALTSLGVSTAVLAWDTHHIAKDADATLQTVNDTLKVQSVNLAADEQRLYLVLEHADATFGQVDQAAKEQRAYWLKTSADSDKTVKALRLAVDRASLLLDHTDKQLNGSLLPDLDRNVELTASAAQMSLASFGHAGDELTFQLDDPAIADLATNLDKSAASLVETNAHLEKTTADIEQAVHRLTRPPSLIKQIGMGILDTAAKLGSIAAGFVR